MFTVSGGTGPYVVATDRPTGTTVSGGNVTLNATSTFVAGDVINIVVVDSKSKTVSAKITCQ